MPRRGSKGAKKSLRMRVVHDSHRVFSASSPTARAVGIVVLLYQASRRYPSCSRVIGDPCVGSPNRTRSGLTIDLVMVQINFSSGFANAPTISGNPAAKPTLSDQANVWPRQAPRRLSLSSTVNDSMYWYPCFHPWVSTLFKPNLSILRSHS
jgi:hypothetical protein